MAKRISEKVDLLQGTLDMLILRTPVKVISLTRSANAKGDSKIFAAYIPARRAAARDPMRALRYE